MLQMAVIGKVYRKLTRDIIDQVFGEDIQELAPILSSYFSAARRKRMLSS